MKSTAKENVAEHSFHTAILAHALGVINHTVFGGEANPDRLASLALFHESAEVFTGDLPTPVKYANEDIRTAYKALERGAEKRLIAMLPPDFQKIYAPYVSPSVSEKEKMLLAAADKIAALIKCMEETKVSNREFAKAENYTLGSIQSLGCEEADYFIKFFLPAYSLTLDELE